MTSRIAILGGTFDPIHNGHLAIAEDVRFALSADSVLFVPAAQQPLKADRHAASPEARLMMVQLGIADNPAFIASDLEIRRGGLSYTVETVARLHTQYSQADLYFIIGADAALDLPRWFNINGLLQLCRLAIVQRPGYALELEALFTVLPAARDRVVVVDGPALDISASAIRQRLRSGRPVRYHLPAAVYQYIMQHGLYQDG